MANIALFWFRNDLRLDDNPGLCWLLQVVDQCSRTEQIPSQIFCIFIDENDGHVRPDGAAANWWKHGSLLQLSTNCEHAGLGRVQFFQGKSEAIFAAISQVHTITHVAWNRRYHPEQIAADSALKKRLRALGCEVKSFAATLLQEPWDCLKEDGTLFKVFTPFWKRLKKISDEQINIGALNKQNNETKKLLKELKQKTLNRTSSHLPLALQGGLKDLKLLPNISWDKEFYDLWRPGEQNAQMQLRNFLNQNLSSYLINRDFPGQKTTSQLSAALRFGELSPRRIWAETLQNEAPSDVIQGFLRQLAWRDFSHSTLFYAERLHEIPLRKEFLQFPFRNDHSDFKRWKLGTTGYPIVDAGMRQLWRTGIMHNRVRMIVGSFLVKHLLLPWQWGEQWFWDTLIDACPANNPCSWQWVTGCGLDAAPFFRVFNPVLQGLKFDSQGTYVRLFVPELNGIAGQHIQSPWDSSPPRRTPKSSNTLLEYPNPVISLEDGRNRALKAFEAIKKSQEIN